MVQETIVPISMLQMMKKRVGGTIKAVYPNDPNLWDKWLEFGTVQTLFSLIQRPVRMCV
jgi:hypothetical protein